MDELIARLEAVTVGDRMLDGDIREAIGEWKNIGGHWLEHKSTGERKRGSILDGLPNYTTSLDAALTLLKEGWGWTCNKTITFDCGAQVFGHDIHADGNAKTPALAMCSAALRARSHTAPQEK